MPHWFWLVNLYHNHRFLGCYCNQLSSCRYTEWISWCILPWELEGITSSCCLLIVNIHITTLNLPSSCHSKKTTLNLPSSCHSKKMLWNPSIAFIDLASTPKVPHTLMHLLVYTQPVNHVQNWSGQWKGTIHAMRIESQV